MTALSGLMIFLVTIIIILHLNIELCFGSSTRSKYFLVEAKAKNASLVNHASLRSKGTMANRRRKIKKSETAIVATSPAALDLGAKILRE